MNNVEATLISRLVEKQRTMNSVQSTMINYAKQSQFLKTENEHKPLLKKGLRKKTVWPVLQKQTQTNPICSELVEPISPVPILQYVAKWGSSGYSCVFELAVYNLILRDGNVMHSTPKSKNFYGEDIE